MVVHVTGSYWSLRGALGWSNLDVTIDSVKYQLMSEGPSSMLALGDYHARILAPKKTPAYIVNREYEFLFPDGKTAKFQLCGEWAQ